MEICRVVKSRIRKGVFYRWFDLIWVRENTAKTECLGQFCFYILSYRISDAFGESGLGSLSDIPKSLKQVATALMQNAQAEGWVFYIIISAAQYHM